MTLAETRNRWAGWSTFIVRPSVAFTIPWVGVCALWTILRTTVVRFPADASVVERVVSPTQFGWATAINAALVLALLADGRKALSSPPDLRRAHLTTVAMALALVIMLQVGAFLAVEPLHG